MSQKNLPRHPTFKKFYRFFKQVNVVIFPTQFPVMVNASTGPCPGHVALILARGPLLSYNIIHRCCDGLGAVHEATSRG